MLVEEIKNLFSADECVAEYNNISSDLMKSFDDYILGLSVESCSITPEVFNIYKKFVSMKPNAPENMKNELFSVMKKFIKEKISNKEYIDALFMYRFLIVKSKLVASSYYEISEILYNLGENVLAKEFLYLYERYENNKPLRYLSLANFYNLYLKDYKSAIKYYERYLKIDETKSTIYVIVGSLYAKEYGELSLKDQIYYYEKAYKLKPNDRLILLSLAFCYEKYGDKNLANFYYQELLKNSPTATDYYNYGAFLISCGEFELGHNYFRKRFETGDANLVYPISCPTDCRWDLKTDISDKTLLIHYEQGYGDTFMYCRFVPMLKGIAKKIIFVVQDEVFDIIKCSKIMTGIKLISNKQDISTIKYDVSMALLDAPYVLRTRSDLIPYVQHYLKVSSTKIKAYAKNFIRPSKNIKVGIACQGDMSSNYSERDIELTKFNRLFDMIGFDFYLLSKGHIDDERVVSLGDGFEDFMDTACAIKNMDIVISTDNVILNLAGALGVKTIGLYTKNPNFRWFRLAGENVGWYNSVRPLQVDEDNCWSSVFSKLINILSELKNN